MNKVKSYARVLSLLVRVSSDSYAVVSFLSNLL